MKSKNFDYRKVPDHTIPRKRWIKRPMLQVTLFNGMKHKQVVCLVDSGASSIEAYMHSIEIQIQDFPERLKIEAGFTESEGVDAILGQGGFFENLRICFDRSRWRIEVSSRAEPRRRW